jgi:DNA-binding MarR family transcriptional regulator
VTQRPEATEPTEATERPELAAAFHRWARLLIEREQSLLAPRGLDLWDYMVLSRLGTGAAPAQGQLADAIGRDATRLIPILDRLADRGLLRRTPDPRDRRNRIVDLTASGQRELAACRAAIRAMEDALLAELPTRHRRELLDCLPAMDHLVTRQAANRPPEPT